MTAARAPGPLKLPAETAAASGACVRRALAVLLAALAALIACPAAAGEYAVSPLRVDLDRAARSGAVTVTNSGGDRMDFQIAVMAWSQDADGRDRYTPSSEIVFFPKILTLQPGESRVIRVGIQAIPVAAERTYRLFIEPIQIAPREPLKPGANIAINLRFALPVFVKPPKREAAGEIEAAALRKGVLTLTLRNTGNEHLRMEDGVAVVGHDARGDEIFAQKIEGRYLLAGVARPISVTLPAGVCARLATVEIAARAEPFTLSRKLDVDRTNCE